MPTNVTGTGTTWNLPNYAGELFSASPTKTPFLSAIGGLTGGLKSESDEFIVGQLYDLPTAAQPAITEADSVTAPDATAIVREQKTNVTQIFHEAISLTYAKMANRGKLSGLNLAGKSAEPASDLDFQVARRLEKIARDVEFTFLNGSYQKATADNVANKTRGMLELCDSGTTLSALDNNDDPTILTLDMLRSIYKAMADAGAQFGNMKLFCNSFQKQLITKLYESQLGYNVGAARNEGGMNVTKIETDFFAMDVVYDPFMPTDKILIADISCCAPVFQEVPGKGVLFLEDLAKTGAAERKQLYGEIGLDHGPAFMHASITGLLDE